MAEKDSDFVPSNLSTDDDILLPSESTSITKTIRSNKRHSRRPKKRKVPNPWGPKYAPVSSSETPGSSMSPTPTTPLSPMSISSPFSFTQPTTSTIATAAGSKLLHKFPKVERESISLECKIDGNENKMTKVYVPEFNILDNSMAIQNSLSLMAVCKICKIGELEIFDNGKNHLVQHIYSSDVRNALRQRAFGV